MLSVYTQFRTADQMAGQMTNWIQRWCTAVFSENRTAVEAEPIGLPNQISTIFSNNPYKITLTKTLTNYEYQVINTQTDTTELSGTISTTHPAVIQTLKLRLQRFFQPSPRSTSNVTTQHLTATETLAREAAELRKNVDALTKLVQQMAKKIQDMELTLRYLPQPQ